VFDLLHPGHASLRLVSSGDAGPRDPVSGGRKKGKEKTMEFSSFSGHDHPSLSQLGYPFVPMKAISRDCGGDGGDAARLICPVPALDLLARQAENRSKVAPPK
jgi:hypothetical protein